MFSNVKEAVDLRGFLEHNGIVFHLVGKHWRSDACPACGPGPKQSNRVGIELNDMRWRCFSCGEGGDVIDAASALWGMPVHDAAMRLAREQWVPMTQQIQRPKKEVHDEVAQEAVTAVLKQLSIRLRDERPDSNVLSYLTGTGEEQRALPLAIVREAFGRGMLRFLPGHPLNAKSYLERVVGRPLLESAGLWHPEKKMPAIAFRPIVFLLPGETSAEFRMARKPNAGERKALRYGSSSRPWFWEGDGSHGLSIVEGAIDTLSKIALGWPGDVIGLPGASVWRPEWLAGATRIDVCLDPDKAGIRATADILEAAAEMGITAHDAAPPVGTDVNDQLRLRSVQLAA